MEICRGDLKKPSIQGKYIRIMDTYSRIAFPLGKLFWRYFVCVLVFLGVIQIGAAQGPSHIIRPPLVRGTKDVALLIVSEIDLENTAYEELADALQAESSIPLWLCLLDTKTDGPPTPDNMALSVMMGLEELTIQGMNADAASIFLAGHGKGGDVVAEYVYQVPDLFRGIILMGTYLKPKFKASAFPVPVMTISGDLDGISRLTRVAEAFRSLEKDVTFDMQLIYHSPVIIMDGFNHGVYSSGELPGPMQAHDIDSEGTIQDGQRLVANSTALFVAYTLQYPTSFVDVAKIQFRQAYEKAQFITKPILDIKEMTQNTQGESYFIRVAQKWLSGLQGNESTRLTVESYIVGDATEIPPTVLTEGEQSVVITFSDVLRAAGREGEEPETPVEIAARMVSPARIKKQLLNTTIVNSYTCKDLNYVATQSYGSYYRKNLPECDPAQGRTSDASSGWKIRIQEGKCNGSYLTAYHTASETARRRFDNKHRGIIFHHDKLVQSDLAWKLTQIVVTTKHHELHVTAISYMTPDIEKLGERAGLYYCKILPPDRALEWIYVDSLRRNMPS